MGKRLQGQVVGVAAEGVFQFGAQGFQGQEGVGDEADDDWGHQADAVEQAEGQPEAVQVGAAVDDDRVGKGQRGVGDAFAAGQCGAQFMQVALEGGGDGRGDFAGLQAFAQPFAGQQQGHGGPVFGLQHTLAVSFVQEQVDVGAGVGAGQLVLQQMGEGAQMQDHRPRERPVAGQGECLAAE